jgi:hypothetical protein
MMQKRIVGTDLEKEFYLLIEIDEDENDDSLSRLVAVMKYPLVSKVMAQVSKLLFKGRYYSNKYNFRIVVNTLRITSSEYNEAINKLVNSGILVEVRERVYELGENMIVVQNGETKTE